MITTRSYSPRIFITSIRHARSSAAAVTFEPGFERPNLSMPVTLQEPPALGEPDAELPCHLLLRRRTPEALPQFALGTLHSTNPTTQAAAQRIGPPQFVEDRPSEL